MVNGVRTPPAAFRLPTYITPIVSLQEHFARRRPAILAACDAYAAGDCRVGHFGVNPDAAAAATQRQLQRLAELAAADPGGGNASNAEPAAGAEANGVAAAALVPMAMSDAGAADAACAAAAGPSSGDSDTAAVAVVDEAVQPPPLAAAATQQQNGTATQQPDGTAPPAGTSEGFRLVLAQLRPRLQSALDSVAWP